MPNLSAVPAVPVRLDLGDGEKTYRLRWTNYAQALFVERFGGAFEGHEELRERFLAAQAEGDNEKASAIYNELPKTVQLRSIAYALWAMLQYEHESDIKAVVHALPYTDDARMLKLIDAVNQARGDGQQPAEEGDKPANPTKPTSARAGKRKPKTGRSSSSKSASRSRTTSS